MMRRLTLDIERNTSRAVEGSSEAKTDHGPKTGKGLNNETRREPMRKILIGIALASVASLAAATPDTSLVLKPTPEQVKAAHVLGNKKCPVSGDEIGGRMGTGNTIVYKGQAIQLCCPACLKKFSKDPDRYFAVAQASVEPEKHDMKDMPGM